MKRVLKKWEDPDLMISISHHMFKVLPIPWMKQVELTRCTEDLKTCAMCGRNNHDTKDNTQSRVPTRYLLGRRGYWSLNAQPVQDMGLDGIHKRVILRVLIF